MTARLRELAAKTAARRKADGSGDAAAKPAEAARPDAQAAPDATAPKLAAPRRRGAGLAGWLALRSALAAACVAGLTVSIVRQGAAPEGAASGFGAALLAAGAAQPPHPASAPAPRRRPSPPAGWTAAAAAAVGGNLATIEVPTPSDEAAAPAQQPLISTFSLEANAQETVAASAPPPSFGVDPLPVKPLSGDVGFALVDVSTGALLAGRLLDEEMIPASVAKTPTAMYAFDTLGPDATFATKILAEGDLRDGVLHGTLYLVGGCDPTLDAKAMRALAKRLAAAGVAEVRGRFLYDRGGFPEVGVIDPDQPVDARYNPGVSGLNLNFNRAVFSWTKKKGADPVFLPLIAGTAKPARDLEILIAPENQEPIYLYDDRLAFGRPDGERWRMERWRVRPLYFRRDGRRMLPVRRPAQHAAFAFAALAAAEGVVLPTPEPGQAAEDAREIARHESRPLADIVRGMMKHSTNITAEALGVAASRARGVDMLDAPASEVLARSAEAMSAWARERFFGEGAAEAPVRLVNHSGLSIKSRLSAAAMAQMLAATSQNELMYEVTPAYRKAPLAHGATARAKTGTIYYGRGLAGYIDCPERRLAFAYFNTDLKGRAEFDAIRAATHANKTRHARRWLARARVVERRLLSDWAEKFCAPASSLDAAGTSQ